MGRFDEGIQAIERDRKLNGDLPINRGLIGYAYARAD